MKTPLVSVRLGGLVAGAALFLAIVLAPPLDFFVQFIHQKFANVPAPDALLAAQSLQRAFAVLLLMVTWWLTEALPVPVTALVPAVAAPLLRLHKLKPGPSGEWELLPLKAEVFLANYADNIVFLFFGGYVLAAAMTYQGLDKRITFGLLSVRAFTRTPARLLLALMGVTALVSMWMNNTSVTAMLMPIGVGLATTTRYLAGEGAAKAVANFSACIVLGIAYSASIGGIATIVGSTPNGIAVSMLRQAGIADLSFAQWLPFGLPAAALILLAAWFWLPVVLPFGAMRFTDVYPKVAAEKAKLGPMGVGEKRVLLIFLATALAWLTIPLLKGQVPRAWDDWLGVLAEPWVVALAAAVALFIVPQSLRARKPLVTWAYAQSQTDWGSLLLFGGGLAMSKMLAETHAVELVAQQAKALMGEPSLPVLVFGLALFVNFLTEITSNTAVAAMMTPLAISLAQQSGLPVVPVVMAIAFGASMAFMLPIATPPNAIAYGTGLVTVRQMARTGLMLNLLSTLVIGLVIWLVGG
jgi:solute carrier family 13 (sodium-dependent dicarboxylate transporter), member 2/3/5